MWITCNKFYIFSNVVFKAFFILTVIPPLLNYLSSHLFFLIFFASHYIFILQLKNHVNHVNMILSPQKSQSMTRSMINTPKAIFLNTNLDRRFKVYFNYYIKLNVVKKN